MPYFHWCMYILISLPCACTQKELLWCHDVQCFTVINPAEAEMLQTNSVNIMAADALAPCVARP